jgi:hypothetical protein
MDQIEMLEKENQQNIKERNQNLTELMIIPPNFIEG